MWASFTPGLQVRRRYVGLSVVIFNITLSNVVKSGQNTFTRYFCSFSYSMAARWSRDRRLQTD